MNGSNIIDRADEEISTTEEAPQSLEEFLEVCQDNPNSVAHSVKYILEAIESCETRTVIEEGEEMERYRFFDDPYGDGEHAVLGNTEVLNEFVDELRRMASEDGENERIIWIEGPTATGKSELKRCFINGLRGFSKSEEGRRYTLEWSLSSLTSGNNIMTYGESRSTDGDWYRSPVNVNPLSVLPEGAQEEVLEEVNEGEERPVSIETDIDPFSAEAFNSLKKEYSGEENVFSQIASSDHLRVVRDTVDVGDGVGVLHSEDGGNPKQKLVGDWMQGAMEEFASRGRKNPQAFSYDGILCQGNGLLTVIEDAKNHTNLLLKLLNVSEEKMVKLDKKISMDIDTLLMVISNPDLEADLRQFESQEQQDPHKALRRRMDKYELGYLTSVSSESQLIRRMLMGENKVWTETGEDAIDKAAEPIEVNDTELAPHTIETAAMFEVITRLDDDPNGVVNKIGKAVAFERGYIKTNGERRYLDDLNIDSEFDGEKGVPVTYTVDVLIDLVQNNDIVMPWDAVEAIEENMVEAPIFSNSEAEHFQNMAYDVDEYLLNELEGDTLEAMVGDEKASEEEVSEYVDNVFAWEEEEEEEYDEMEMEEFERKYLGLEGRSDQFVADYRESEIIPPLNSYIWGNRDPDFTTEDLPFHECEPLQDALTHLSWDTVIDNYPHFDKDQWANPPEGSETEELKEKAIENMIEEFGYSEESAELATTRVLEQFGHNIPEGEE